MLLPGAVIVFLFDIIVGQKVTAERSFAECGWNYDCRSCVESSSQCAWSVSSVSEYSKSDFLTLDPNRKFQCSNVSDSWNLNINGSAQTVSRLRNYPKSLAVDRVFLRTTVVEYCDAVNRDFQVTRFTEISVEMEEPSLISSMMTFIESVCGSITKFNGNLHLSK